jgi:hypothetical protein
LASGKRKVENFKNPGILWQPVAKYCVNMAISENRHPLKSDDFGTFFSGKMSFV